VHIPDGYLGPETVAAGWVIAAPVWYAASRKTKKIFSKPKAVPVLAASAAFSFLVMMLNVPVLGGTTAHAVGATLIAIVAGPWVAVMAVTSALAIQALLFADGGLLSFGINSLNMAIIMPFAGYAIYQLIGGNSELRSARRLVGAAVGSYFGIVLAAFAAGVELGIQPLLHTVNGIAQYNPYHLSTTIPAMTLSHMLIAGPVEAAFTVGVFAFLARTSPELFSVEQRVSAPLRSFYAVVALLVIATPLGLLATGTAFGEWGGSELLKRVGYVPHGLATLGDLWRGVLPDYGQSNASGVWGVVMYVVSALVGVAVLAGLAWLIVRLYRRRGTAQT
jgi:cobalt/nickel transport system permease protein